MQYVFGDYTLDLHRDDLYGPGGVVRLDRQVFAVLAYLVRYRDRVVRRQELFESLWPARWVSDAALERCIAVARRAVGDNGRSQRVIQTVHGRGYRFVAPVEEQPSPPFTPGPPPLRSPGAEETGGADATSPVVLAPASPHPLLAALDDEYKLVTVCCCALEEAPPLDARLGPEALHRAMQAVFAQVQEVLRRYEGTLTHVTGDGCTAVFGAPVAHEDHAQRAVLAALALHRQLRAVPHEVPLAARIGLHTGPVVVGPRADAPHHLYTAAGATVQLAVRLQRRAAPGTVLVSATTYRLVQAEVHADACGVLDSDGQGAAVPVYTVHGPQPRHTEITGWAGRPLRPLVGRALELAALEALRRRVAGGQGQVVSLVGEPGMGKTRLVQAFCQGLALPQVTVLAGRCTATGQGTPYLPVREILQHAVGLSEETPPATTVTQVPQQLQALGIPPAEAAPYLLALLGVADATTHIADLRPELLRRRTFAALHALLLRQSQQRPLLVVVENLHWSDPTSHEFLTELVERLAGASLMLLVTCRPGARLPWLEKSYATQLPLAPLGPEDSRHVVEAVLHDRPCPEGLVQAIVAKAAGNPLFLEELAWAAREHGAQRLPPDLPATVQAVLAARMDRLSPAAKRLLQTAAVIGPEVPVLLLQTIARLSEDDLRHGLRQLQAAEFLSETRLVPDLVYTFKHVLTHEMAYGSLLQERRRALHARIVEALEALAPERMAQQVERLAHHAIQGEVWDKAVTYSRQAGANALVRSALHEAAAFFAHALGALQHLPESRTTREQAIDLCFDLRNALIPRGEFERILDYLRQAEPLAEALGDSRRLGQLAGYMTNCLCQLDDLDGARASAQRTVARATALGEGDLQVAAHNFLGNIYWHLSDYRRAAAVFRRNVEFLHGAPLQERFGTAAIQAVYSQALLARCLAELGAFAEGRVYAEDALRLAETCAHPYSLAQACAAVGLFYMHQGALPQAVCVFERGLTVSKTAHLLLMFRAFNGRLGAAYALSGRVSEALPLLEQALERTVAMRQFFNYAPFAVWLGEGYVLAGRLLEAKHLGQQALKAAQTRKQHGHHAYALRLLGESAAHGDPPDGALAEAHYQQALTLAAALGMRPLQAHCYRGLGALYAQTGRPEPARTALATALEMYQAMAMTFWLPQAEAALAQVDA
jgi:predicted ATPase/class 3 adenylate cyclase/DNA-binding winged helix-turn-helix (wHTH) protein